MKMGIYYCTYIRCVDTPAFQGFEKPMGLVRHPRIDDDVMPALGEQGTGGTSPTAGKEHLGFPCGVPPGRIGGLKIPSVFISLCH
jgi:hypothetical protein